MPSHIALLGDSIFDNAVYTGGEPDVADHLQSMLPEPWQVSLCAIDGSVIADLKRQARDIPPDVSHIIISIGGNDALMNSDLLAMPVSSTTEALRIFAKRSERFEADYRKAIGDVLALGHPTTICTIYNGNLDPAQAGIARIALMLFNDAILRVGFELRLPVIDLRLVCNEPADYANPIEPSGRGGRKIAAAIARSVGAMGGDSEYSRVVASD